MTLRSVLLSTLCWLAVLTRPATAIPFVDLPADDLAQRDALIQNLITGHEVDTSVEKLRLLWQSLTRVRQQAQDAEAQQAELRKQHGEDSQTLDAIVGDHCRLAKDPGDPKKARYAYDGMRADWGKVIVRQVVKTPPKNAFEDGEEFTAYRIQGRAKTYSVSSKGPHYLWSPPLEAQVGDLVLVCMLAMHTEGSGSKFPPEFRENILSQGFVARIAAPPLVERLAQDPLHLLGQTRFRMAIERVEWDHPSDQTILARLEVAEELPKEGTLRRFLIRAEKHTYLLEVPPGVRDQALLGPGRRLWAVMGQARLDRDLKKLVFVAERLDAHHIQPTPASPATSVRPAQPR